QDGMDFIDMYCMCYVASLCITSSFYSSFATPSKKKSSAKCLSAELSTYFDNLRAVTVGT
ncbi:hypothetical protein, partial [Parageobacillus toebii]|uniref:hypothetical protein n=1 Tax=Parageobacillus toebii TaxID=153151 RepID=UPI001C84C003